MAAPRRNLKGALLALGAFAVFASHDAAVKALGASYHAAQIVLFSALFGLPAVLLLIIRERAPLTLRPRDPWGVALRSGAVALASLCSFFAFSRVPMAQAYAIFFSTPILVTLLAVPLLGEKVGLRRAVAIAVGMAGVLIVLRPGQAPLGIGHLAALGAALASSLVAIMTRKLGGSERTVVLLVYPMLVNVAVMGLAQPFVYRPVAGADLLLMIYVAFGAFFAMSLLIAAYRNAEAVLVAPMQYSQIIWAVIFGLAFFGEMPDLQTLIGAGIVMASGLYILMRERRLHGAPVAPAAPPTGQGAGGTLTPPR
ncbi:MAG: DMT family transporter [Gemmobacter sp.]|jgi:S-adenosylmethionine uptake transporter